MPNLDLPALIGPVTGDNATAELSTLLKKQDDKNTPPCTLVIEKPGSVGATGQLTLTANAQIIRYRNPDRRALKLTNLGVNPVWVGFSSAVTALTGDLLPGVAGASITIPCTADVYGVAPAGQTISWMEISQ